MNRIPAIAIGISVLVGSRSVGADDLADRWVEQIPQVMASVPVGAAASRDQFRIRPGFQVEKLFEVPKETHGSWVSLALDKRGHLLACDQDGLGLSRIIVPPVGSRAPTRVEKLTTPITSAQGMLYAFDALYVSVNDGGESGLYRVLDTRGDGEFDQVERLNVFLGGGEHGPHSIRMGPDGKSLYIVCGNHTAPPPRIDASRQLPNWNEDLLLPRQWDARGHARGRMAPGGWIVKTDPEGERWEIVSTGYRNAYDFAFNADGEMFAYDADMEWDFGMPWYRPTRLLHATSGSDFGWRSGTGKWPNYFADSLPSAIDLGPGSPTGVVFGIGAKFPAKYQRALFLLDWTFGTMYAVHLRPDGASYVGEKEEFLSRAALPLTDAVIGKDGALYFAIGGRGTQSSLYRVAYLGDESSEPVDGHDQRGAELRRQRRRLESYHSTVTGVPRDVDLTFIWDQLGHEDRFIRYAARIALEWQPLEDWRERALTESDSVRRIQGAIALARAGSREWNDDPASRDRLRKDILRSLSGICYDPLSSSQRCDLLRAYALGFIRLGAPSAEEARSVAERLDPFFPGRDVKVNREMARVMVYLKAPSVVQKSLDLMRRDYAVAQNEVTELLDRNPHYGETIAEMMADQPETEKLHYLHLLSNVRYGWTLEERRLYFDELNVALQRKGGASYEGFIRAMRDRAFTNLSESEKEALQSDTMAPPPGDDQLPKPRGPGHPWTVEEVIALAEQGLAARNFEEGRRAFASVRCVVCHRFDGAGGATGPDLTSVAGRFSIGDLVDALMDPSRVVSDQYRASVIETDDGHVITGRILNEMDGDLEVQVHPEDATRIKKIARANVVKVVPSSISLMPEKLIDSLNAQEVLDLLAYVLSRGDPDDPMFQGATP